MPLIVLAVSLSSPKFSSISRALKKYSKAAEYVWEKIQGRITERVYSMMGYKFTLRGLYRRAISKLLFNAGMRGWMRLSTLGENDA
jgi:hypothetical protein